MKHHLRPSHAVCLVLALAFQTTAGFSSTPYEIVTVTPGTQSQIIDGFGTTVSQFSALYTDLNYYNNGSTAVSKTVFDLLFNSTNGAGLSLARSQIWCLNGDTSEPIEGGGFSYTTPAILSQVWALQEAQSRHVERFYALPWSAPAWMKANNNCSGDTEYQESYPDAGTVGTTSYLGTLTNVNAHDLDFTTYIANYVVAFQQLYQINFGWVGIMNECNTENPLWPTCYFDPTHMAEILPKLQNALNSADLGTYETACETSNIEQPAEAGPPLQTAANSAQVYTTAVFGNSANDGISYITTHYYGDDHMLGYDTDLNASSYPTHTGLWRLWQAEICKKSDTDTWPEALAWSTQIHQFMEAGWSAWSYWEGVSALDLPDGQSLIGVTTAGVATPTNRLYMMGQFARYIRPGFRLIESGGDDKSIIVASAYHNPGNGQIVVVISNTDTTAGGHLIQVDGLGAGVKYDVCSSSPLGTWDTSAGPVTADGSGDAQITVPTTGITTLAQEVDDTTAPGTITLTGSIPTGTTNALLKWTATGNDGGSGTARNYDLRYRDKTAHEALTTGTWGNSYTLQWMGVPPTMEVGTDQKTVIYGPFVSGHVYDFAIESMSWGQVASTMSNVIELTPNP